MVVSTFGIFLANPTQAYEYKETNAHAAKVDAGVTLGIFTAGKGLNYLGKEAPALTTQVLQDSQIAERMTENKINQVMTAIKNSPTALWTVGDRGGGVLKIRLDLNQFENYVATQNVDHLAENMKKTATHIAGLDQTLNGQATSSTHAGYSTSSRPVGVAAFSGQVDAVSRGFKPRWGEITINVGKAGLEGSRSQLEQVLSSGAAIERITLQSLASRALIPTSLKLLGAASLLPTFTHAFSAFYRGVTSLKNNALNENDAVCRPQSHCQEPGPVQKVTASTAPLPGWLPITGIVKDAR